MNLSPANATGNNANEIVASGASSDSPQNAWVLGKTALAITHNGGGQWTHLSPPISPQSINDVAVLANKTIVLSGAGSEDVGIHTLVAGSSSWQSQTVALNMPVGQIQLVQANGVPVGIMVTEESGSNFSHGLWLSTQDSGVSWHQNAAPIGGHVTEAGGDLWLVGGPEDSSLYESQDNGVTWQTVFLPSSLTAGQTPALGNVYPGSSSGEVALTATFSIQGQNYVDVQVLKGNATGSGWNWSAGPLVRLEGDYGAGVSVANSLANGVLWVADSTQLARISLATSNVSIVTPDGFPQATEEILHAQGAMTAWASYSIVSCMGSKSNCNPITGLVTTTDGGQVWAPSSNPLA